jgi:hypothetical protein
LLTAVRTQLSPDPIEWLRRFVVGVLLVGTAVNGLSTSSNDALDAVHNDHPIRIELRRPVGNACGSLRAP